MPSETESDPTNPTPEHHYNLNYTEDEQFVLITALRGFVLDMLTEADSARCNGREDFKDECIRRAIQAQDLVERMDPMHEEPQWTT